MKYCELIGQRLIGFQQIIDEDGNPKQRKLDENINLLLFLGDNILKAKQVYLVSNNKNYSYYTNWRLVEADECCELNSTYKSIGEVIREIETDNKDSLDTDNLDADDDLWEKSVGKGTWHVQPDVNYFYITIKTNTKNIKLGTVYHDCHYPETIWEFI